LPKILIWIKLKRQRCIQGKTAHFQEREKPLFENRTNIEIKRRNQK